MKNSINYYTREERNGLTLLITVVILFTVFVFLQNYNVRKSTTVHIQVNSTNESTMNEFDQNTHYSTALQDSKSNDSKNPVEYKGESKSEPSFKKLTESKSSDERVAKKKLKVQFESDKKHNLYSSDTKQKFKDYKRKESQYISLSSTTQEEWQKLRGIGKVFSGRIIKYKNWLGGFHSVVQLKEVYGMTDSLYQTIEPFIKPNVQLKYININQCTVKKLGKHPYVNWKDAKKIIAYRKQHGAFKSTSDLDKIIGLDRKSIEKFKPYITFKNNLKLENASKEAYAQNN